MTYLFALGAGFAMNLTPCLLPVIGLKLRAFSQPDKKTPYVLGVFVSFMILATIAVVAGAGLSHMSIDFVRATLAGVCIIMGTKLMGWWQWHIRIPGSDVAGPFGVGIMTVALGTSCSVPFLAPVLVYCASAGALATYGIFACMALGFVSPFLVSIPMPKPGEWMVQFEKGCGAALVVVGGWLCWTLPYMPLIGVMLSLHLIFLLISMVRMEKGAFILSILSVILSIATVALVPKPQAPEIVIPTGNRVIIVTADWCLTCPVVRRSWRDCVVTLSLYDHHMLDITVLDWTDHDPKITAFLKKHNHQSVPFALVEIDGRVTILSGLYSVHDILDALEPRNE